jgi:DNA-binding NarL/FixJ family response regulator
MLVPHRLSGSSLRVLLLEPSVADARLMIQELERAGANVTSERVTARDPFTRALRDFAPNVVIAEHSVAQFDARSAIRFVRAVRPTVPLIVVSGAIDGTSMVACVRDGAEGLVLKTNLPRLPIVVDQGFAIRRRLGKLTPRQVEVLRLVAEGHTTRAIADRLRLSVKTVESHRGEIMKRLEIHDVVGIVRYAVRVGLVPIDV